MGFRYWVEFGGCGEGGEWYKMTTWGGGGGGGGGGGSVPDYVRSG